MKKKTKLLALIPIFVFLIYTAANAANAPALKEGTYLTGQTLSGGASWSSLGNALGVALPTDPINQLAPAGTCSASANRFCTADNQCPASETCVLHDPATGWSVADRRFSFACAMDSYAYRYIVSTTPGAYTVRARFEDTGLPIANFSNFVSGFVSTSIFKIDEAAGICNQDQEISTMQLGACGDGKINPGEQCDPPGIVRYGACAPGNTVKVDVCSRACQWTPSTTPYVPCSALSKCGNGAVEAGETCDDGSFNGRYNKCNTTCAGLVANPPGRCGDGVLQSAYEICDPGAVLAGGDRYDLTKANSCQWDCQNFGPYCGDSITQTQFGEECDGSQSCAIDGQTGIRACASDCKKVMSLTSPTDWECAPSSAAPAVSASGTCGDAVVGENEACDRGLANNGRSCQPSYGAPCSYCSADCQNTVDVQPTEYCGNGIIENPEKCEVAGGTIYSAVANAASTVSTLSAFSNGYRELACSAETSAPHTIKKGAKTCADCSAGVVRNCVVCGADKNGTAVDGDILNVLDNTLMASFVGSSPDPLFARITNNSSLSLAIGGSCSRQYDPSTHEDLIVEEPCAVGTPNSLTVAKAAKNRVSSDLVSYALLNPYLAGSPIALINSNPICSTDDNPNYKYQMYVNYDWTRPLNFPVVAEPQSWQYDLALSPVVSRSLRPNDLRIVASWVGSGDFYSGVLNPFAVSPDSPEIEGPSYVLSSGSTCTGIACTYYYDYEYATGTNYYNLITASKPPAFGLIGSSITLNYKKHGIWYHGFDSTSGQTSIEPFTIDTAAMEGNTYSFYVRSPGYPIRQFKNTARLKVDVYLPENETNQYHFGTPAKTYYFTAAVPSDNPNARYWQVFNINKPSAGLSQSDIIDINTIVTDPEHFIYFTPLAAETPVVPAPIYAPPAPACVDADWQSSLSPMPCPVSGAQTRTWTKVGVCEGGVTHPASETASCTYTASLSVVCSPFPTSINTGGSATWTAAPTGGIGAYSYTWSGTDSLTGSSQSVSKTYSIAGTKTGSVTVTSGAQSITQACSNSVTVTASIPPLSASCSASPTSITAGQSSVWTAVPTGGTGSYSYNWSGTDSLTGLTPLSQSVSKTYSIAGTKTGNVTIISGTQSITQACSNSVTVTASIPPLSASCSASPTSITTGQISVWEAKPTGGTGSYSYNWSGTDSLTGSRQSVSKTYSIAGTKIGSVTIISDTQSITQACGSGVTVAAIIPTPPQNLRVTSVSPSYINIAWDPPASDGGVPLQYYFIYRGPSPGSEPQQGTTIPPVTTWSEGPLGTRETVCFKVTARNSVGISGFSNEVCGTTASKSLLFFFP